MTDLIAIARECGGHQPGHPYDREDCIVMDRDQLAAFAARIASRDGWLPIETAPKDGTLLVLGARNGVWLGKYLPVYDTGYRPENPWTSLMLNHDHMAERFTRPTNWQPLPASPKDQQ